MGAPQAQGDEHRRQGQHLTHLHPRIETYQIDDEAVLRQLKLLQAGGQPQAVEQAEDEHGYAGVRLVAQQVLEAAHILEGFIDD